MFCTCCDNKIVIKGRNKINGKVVCGICMICYFNQAHIGLNIEDGVLFLLPEPKQKNDMVNHTFYLGNDKIEIAIDTHLPSTRASAPPTNYNLYSKPATTSKLAVFLDRVRKYKN